MRQPPTCRKCGSAALRATSSQQMRQIRGHRRQVADVVCLVCGHSWWSVHPAIRKLAREADKARKNGSITSHAAARRIAEQVIRDLA